MIAVQKEQGVAVGETSFNKALDENGKANWVHMFHDNALELFDKDIKKLKTIIRSFTVSRDTKGRAGNVLNTPDAIDGAYEANKQDVINHMSGQTHVARVLQFLKDYHTELSGKISAIHMFGEDVPAGKQKHFIVIDLVDSPTDGKDSKAA